MKYLLIFGCLFVIGCTHRVKPSCEPQIVILPTYEIPDNVKSLPTPLRPNLMMNSLTLKDKNDYNKILNSLNVSVLQLQKYVEELESNERIYKQFVSETLAKQPDHTGKSNDNN